MKIDFDYESMNEVIRGKILLEEGINPEDSAWDVYQKMHKEKDRLEKENEELKTPTVSRKIVKSDIILFLKDIKFRGKKRLKLIKTLLPDKELFSSVLKNETETKDLKRLVCDTNKSIKKYRMNKILKIKSCKIGNKRGYKMIINISPSKFD